MASTEPTILIKKADGTTERVPLSSLQKKTETPNTALEEPSRSTIKPQEEDMQVVPRYIPTVIDATVTQSKPDSLDIDPHPRAPEEPVLAHEDLPVAATPHELAMTTPVDDFFVHMAKAHEWTQEDHVSPLEEQLVVASTTSPASATLPQTRYEDVQAIVSAIPFRIPEALYSRLHALVQSRIKDIRTDEQIQTYAMRGVDHGGLGLDADQATVLLKTIHTQVAAVKNTATIPPPRKTSRTPSQRVPLSQPVSESQEVSIRRNSPQQEVSIKDIHPPEHTAVTLGPIDEIGSITLADFRRLSKDPHSAIEVLRAKIGTLREESYLEYIKAQAAWRQSPLYRTYLAYLRASLEKETVLADVLDEMTEEDISVIAAFTETMRF